MGESRLREAVAALAVGLAVLTAATLGLVLLRRLADQLRGVEGAPWVLARAGGLTAYALLLLLVLTGLLLSHPGAARGSVALLRLHLGLAVFTLAFTVLHVVVLATDEHAQVGWHGALLPMAAEHRPVPVTLGVLAGWAGLLTGLTAGLAGRVALRVWWPVHKVAGLVLALTWAHSVLAGSDTHLLRVFYLASGGLVLAVAASRYLARTPADDLAELR